MTAKSVFNTNDGVEGFNEQLALIYSVLNKAAFSTLVRIIDVHLPDTETNNYTGTVDVQPLVTQIDGNLNPISHSVIFGIGYIRIQGGLNAIIIDPQIGDIGLCVFANNDISNVMATKAESLPGSGRRNSWSDGIYIGGLLNGIPLRYMAISDSGIDIISTNTITINAPTINSIGDWNHTGTITATVDVIANGISLHDHVHINSGGTGDGGPPKP